MTNKALFLDRDGVVNVDTKYLYKIEDLQFVSGIFDLVKKAKELNYLVIIITNQSGIGRGYFTEEDFWILMNYIKNEFIKNDSNIDDIFFCPYHKDAIIDKYKIDNHHHRKPNPGMLLDAIIKHNIIPRQSILIGDQMTDLQAGRNAGIWKNVLFKKRMFSNKLIDEILNNN